MCPGSVAHPVTRVLVPLAILEGETVAAGLMELLGTVDVTVLGYHVLPEQTAPGQAHLQYGERATDALEDIVEEFERAGGAADHRLVFTHDRRKTIGRVATETDARAIATTGATGDVGRLLVPLTGDVAVEQILSFVMELIGTRDVGVTLLVAGEETPAVASRLEAATTALSTAGIDVRTEVVDRSPFDAILEAVADHDAIVMGERAPSLSTILFGEESDRLATATVGPVLVVRSGDRPDGLIARLTGHAGE